MAKEMGCLFGYLGLRCEHLLKKMADILSHRCQRGWERKRLELNNECVLDIGHGIAPWSTGSNIAAVPEKCVAFGYSGIFFNTTHHLGQKTASKVLEYLESDSEARIQALEGAFVAAFLNGEELILARDPAGVKVVYWTVHKDRIIFSSEIKAIFADPLVARKLRIGAVLEYLTFSFVPGERTMFENIMELQPGSILKYRNGNTRIRRYFIFENKEFDDTQHPSGGHHVQKLRKTLETSVGQCCSVSKGPPGVFLSGGIDSSAVVALTAREYPQTPVKTFSVHFGPKYANENQFVSMMVDQYGTAHTWLEITPKKFLKHMRRIIWVLDDPIGDPITVPNFLMAEAASRVSQVVLNGEGGDPCFGGPKNIPMLLAQLYGPLPGEPAKDWLEWYYLYSYRKCFTDLGRILNPDVIKASGGDEALTGIIKPFLRASVPKNYLNKLMTINILLKGANLILVKVDKMTAANGILALPPLFSKQIIESSLGCPPELKLVGNIEKGILKRAVEDIVPHPIIQRPKSGMMVPVRFWCRGEMRRFIKRILSRKNLNRLGFFNTDYVRKLIDYDKTEIQGARHGQKLWMLVTFMLWYEQMIEKKTL
jgi:asparagine synthase (glutamine-hydrolysing)